MHITWETATINDLFPIRCCKCGTVHPYIAWMEAFEASTCFDYDDGICCPICGSENGKILGDFVDEVRSDSTNDGMFAPEQVRTRS